MPLIGARAAFCAAELVARLKVYQQTSVPASHHTLAGVNCSKSVSPADHPEWHGAWMPFCAAAAPEGRATAAGALRRSGRNSVRVLHDSDCTPPQAYGEAPRCDAAIKAAAGEACSLRRSTKESCEVVLEPWATC